jgi:hypothetical protein
VASSSIARSNRYSGQTDDPKLLVNGEPDTPPATPPDHPFARDTP